MNRDWFLQPISVHDVGRVETYGRTLKGSPDDMNGRGIELAIIEDGKAANTESCQVRLVWSNGDFEGYDVFDAVDASLGKYRLEFTQDFLSHAGSARCKVIILDGTDTVYSSDVFGVNIDTNAASKSATSSGNEASLFIQAIMAFDTARDAYDEATAEITVTLANAKEVTETATEAATSASEAATAASTAAATATEAADAATEAAESATSAASDANTAAGLAIEAAAGYDEATSDLEDATKAANDAADRANDAADSAESATTDATAATLSANTAADAANAAATAATSAAQAANTAATDVTSRQDANDAAQADNDSDQNVNNLSQAKNNADQAANNAAATGSAQAILSEGEYDADGVPTIAGVGGTIYLVPNTDPEEDDAYTEWLYVNSAWERVGGQTVFIEPIGTENIDAIAAGGYLDGTNVMNLTDLSYTYAKAQDAWESAASDAEAAAKEYTDTELEAYLTSESAQSTYLSKEDAASTYATPADVDTKIAAIDYTDFATKTDISDMLTASEADETYLTKYDAGETYLTIETASEIYATPDDVDTKLSAIDLSDYVTTTQMEDYFDSMIGELLDGEY